MSKKTAENEVLFVKITIYLPKDLGNLLIDKTGEKCYTIYSKHDCQKMFIEFFVKIGLFEMFLSL